jgi:uncharacterized RDD family membrane protein YckC
LAEWWQRLVAIIIDGVILGIAFQILSVIFGGSRTVTYNSNGTTAVHAGTLIVAELIEIAIALVYFGLLDGSAKGQTVGKMAMGIATRDINNGGPIGVGRAVLRRFIYSILWLPLLIPGIINGLSPLWDARRQAWHDKVASSDVIKVR